MSFPKISVIIPVFNSERYISETINSILNQTYKNLELIIVNDGSTDNTEKIIQTISDKRIIYLTKQNGGPCAALNLGLKYSSGDFIKFFDSDDLMNPKHLELQLNRIINIPDSIATCEWGRFYNNDPKTVKFVPETVWEDLSPFEWIKRSLKQESDMMSGWIFLIPRNIINKTGPWNEDLTLNNDFEFGVRLILNSKQIMFAHGAKVYYRSGNTNSISQIKNLASFQSALAVTRLGCSHILKFNNSKEMRMLCANRFQNWVFRIYPFYPELVLEFESEIIKLGGSSIRPAGSRLMNLLNYLLGWKSAKSFKYLINNLISFKKFK